MVNKQSKQRGKLRRKYELGIVQALGLNPTYPSFGYLDLENTLFVPQSHVPHDTQNRTRMGASIYDVHKIFGFFTPSPLSHTEFTQPHSFCLLFGDPLHCGRHISMPPKTLEYFTSREWIWANDNSGRQFNSIKISYAIFWAIFGPFFVLS